MKEFHCMLKSYGSMSISELANDTNKISTEELRALFEGNNFTVNQYRQQKNPTQFNLETDFYIIEIR